MARTILQRKLETYQALGCINEHFEAISRHVQDLSQMGFFRGHKMNVLAGFVRELQSHISHDITDTMHSIEDKEMYQYEQVRREWENYLDPDKTAAKQAQSVNGKVEQQPQAETTAQVNGLATEVQP
jgi:hypothetical protein